MNFVLKIIRFSVLIIAVWTGYGPIAYAQNLLPDEDLLLFKISRSRDADEIWYTLNLNDFGIPDKDQPIVAFWVRKTKGNKIEPLSWVQNKYAYGVYISEPYDRISGNLKFRFVSYEQMTFELRKKPDGSYKVYTSVESKELEVNQVFVQIDGGSFWMPTVPYVELVGYVVSSSKLVAQTIIP